jgi:hypothetical protein
MSSLHAPLVLRRSLHTLLALAVVAVLTAALSANASAAPAVTLTHDPDLVTNPVVTVEGSGWGATGFYVAQVAIVGDTVTAGSSKWVKLGPPGSPNQVELQPDGTFTTTLNATQTLGTSPDEIDCAVEKCFIATWPQHSNPTTASIFTKNRLFFAPGVEVEPAVGIDATGQTISVNGGGIDAALITGNGVNMSQIAIVGGEIKTGPARWIRKAGVSNPAPGPNVLTPSGTFDSDLTVSSTFTTKTDETINCGIVQCKIAFWPGHTNPTVDPPTLPMQGQLIASQDISFAYTPSATVTPTTNLAETQKVTISGSGYNPGSPGVYVSQVAQVGESIVTPPPGGGAVMQWVRPGGPTPETMLNPDGSFETSVTVARTFTNAKGTTVDCTVVQCSLITWRGHSNPSAATLYTSAPLSFSPPVSPIPPVTTPLPTPEVRPSATVKKQQQFKLGTKARKLNFVTVRCGSTACQFQKPKRVALKVGKAKLWVAVTGPKRAGADKAAKFGVRVDAKTAKRLAGHKGRVKFKIRTSSDSGKRTITINKLLVGASK